MTFQLQPSVLPDAQSYTYISDYVEIVDVTETGNTVQPLSNATTISISFSLAQPNVTINIGDNKIWFNGYYTAGESEGFYYFEPPYGNELSNTPTVVYTASSVPPRKLLYKIAQTQPDGVTVTHNLTVNNNSYIIDRYVYPDIYSAYNFLLNYEWYSE